MITGELSPRITLKVIHKLSKEEDRYLSESSRYTPLVKPSALIAAGFIGLGLVNRSARRLSIAGAFVAGASTGFTLYSGERAKIKADSMQKSAHVLRHKLRESLG